EEMLSVGLSQSEIIELRNAALVEQIHVDTLVKVLETMGQKPLEQPKFYFKFSSPVDFLQQLAVQEVYLTRRNFNSDLIVLVPELTLELQDSLKAKTSSRL